MSRLNLRPCLDQGIRKLHPLPIYQVTSFPAAQFETTVVLQNQRRRLARNHFPAHLRLRALVAPGNIHGLSIAFRREEKHKGNRRDATRQRQAHLAKPHRISTSSSLSGGRRSLAVGTGAIHRPTRVTVKSLFTMT